MNETKNTDRTASIEAEQDEQVRRTTMATEATEAIEGREGCPEDPAIFGHSAVNVSASQKCLEGLTNELASTQSHADLCPLYLTHDEVLQRLQAADRLAQLIRAYRSDLSDAIVSWIDTHGDLECGPIRYYTGSRKTTKCIDVGTVVEQVLTDYSVEELIRAMTSQPFKHSNVERLLSRELYGQCYETTYERVMREGVAKKTLKRLDTRFVQKKDTP